MQRATDTLQTQELNLEDGADSNAEKKGEQNTDSSAEICGGVEEKSDRSTDATCKVSKTFTSIHNLGYRPSILFVILFLNT